MKTREIEIIANEMMLADAGSARAQLVSHYVDTKNWALAEIASQTNELHHVKHIISEFKVLETLQYHQNRAQIEEIKMFNYSTNLAAV
jgi:7-cyano-7-deazaguanine synthase in queuosine biosynthesis